MRTVFFFSAFFQTSDSLRNIARDFHVLLRIHDRRFGKILGNIWTRHVLPPEPDRNSSSEWLSLLQSRRNPTVDETAPRVASGKDDRKKDREKEYKRNDRSATQRIGKWRHARSVPGWNSAVAKSDVGKWRRRKAVKGARGIRNPFVTYGVSSRSVT